MRKLTLAAFKAAIACGILMMGYLIGGYNTAKPYHEALYECEQTLPRNEECVLVVVPKRMLQQAPAVAPTRV